MRHGSLFSGIGGFELAAEWMGWQNIFHCEWNDFGKQVLKYYWPESISYDDITKTDFTIHRGQIDILTGGFPCQPYSQAGKRLGKEDDRHLFPEMLRAIREIAPTWVVGENVRGLVNWNGGLVFDEVQADLEAEGYEVQPFLLPACGVNAPHRRDRVWFVATNTRNYSDRLQTERGLGVDGQLLERREWGKEANRLGDNSQDDNATDTNSNGLNECNSNNEINTSQGGINAFSNINESDGNGNATNTTSTGGGQDIRIRKSRFNHQTSSTNYWSNFPTQSPICQRNDGLPSELDRITFSKWRNESIKAYGNAIVPQVALQIFKAISEYNFLNNKTEEQ
jgi:DNA (cytosine-5)-methyltransferase 1